LEPTFFANGAGAGGVRERALGSPTHPLAHRGAWRRKTGRGGSAPPLPFGTHLAAPRALNRKYGRRHLMKTRPGDRARRPGPSPGDMGRRGCHTAGRSLHRVMTSLWSPRAQVAVPVSCAPRQRALGSNRGAARPPRAPPGRSESQLEPPDSWARQRAARSRTCFVPPGFCCLPVSCSGAPKFSLRAPKTGATCGARGMFWSNEKQRATQEACTCC
jgi:hypothetical protein